MTIDILHLVDRLEAIIEQGRRLPLTSAVVVDERAILDIIDQMRISIPEEIKQAKRMQQEREEAIGRAQDEAARIISKGREDAVRLVAEHELRRQAQQQSERILEEAQRQAQAIRQGADDYAANVLTALSEELAATQRTVANGRAALQQRREKTQGNNPPGGRSARQPAGGTGDQAEAL
jgi:vacuolar-type H+-ATPase subunit H